MVRRVNWNNIFVRCDGIGDKQSYSYNGEEQLREIKYEGDSGWRL